MKNAALCLVTLLVAAGAAQSHEFWIEPDKFVVPAGAAVTLDLRVGQLLDGASYPFLSHKFERYDVTVAGQTAPLAGRQGDVPSLIYTPDRQGLNIVSYHARPELLTYDAFSDFVEFVTDEGLSDLADRHRARGLPDAGFIEGYSRNSKALVQVGPVLAGQTDEYTGMPFELVALTNPYAGQETLPVRLLWQGKPVADAQVAIFHRGPDGAVSRSLSRTGSTGIATVPTAASGFYLLSSVRLDERDPASGEVWHSTWAALGFGVPLR